MKTLKLLSRIILLLVTTFSSYNSLAEGCGSSYQNIADKAISAYSQALAVTASNSEDYQYVVSNNGPALQNNLTALRNASTIEECKNAASMLILYSQQMRGNTKSYSNEYTAASASVSSNVSTSSSNSEFTYQE